MKLRTILANGAATVVVMAFAGCAPPFPRELLEKVDRNIMFADLMKNPARYSGKLVMFGGMIVKTTNHPEGSVVEVMQKPLERDGRPIPTDETGGRFLVLVERFLDASVYQHGRSVTVIAEASGSRMQPLDEIEYRYPVLQARDIHLWAPYAGPRISIGIGVYHGF
jgi:outer membrane lipoprotein